MKIHSVEAKLFHAYGRMNRYMMKLIITLHNFVNMPKNCTFNNK